MQKFIGKDAISFFLSIYLSIYLFFSNSFNFSKLNVYLFIIHISNNHIFLSRSKTTSHTLNPTWEETFVMTTADGLHEASYIQLLVKDDGRSGEDHLMGVVYIPKEEFYTASAVKGIKIMSYLSSNPIISYQI